MESCGFEIQDVEALRRHYARTCRAWHYVGLRGETGHRAGRAGALSHVGGLSAGGYPRLRIWSPARVQTVATKQGDALSPLPSPLRDLYCAGGPADGVPWPLWSPTARIAFPPLGTGHACTALPKPGRGSR